MSLLQVGVWNPRDGVNITKDYSQEVVEVADSLKNKTLIVTTILVSTQKNISAVVILEMHFCLE